ncbi:hypothetical protein RhiirC2_266567 [Rhizophagus irregularis]|uniref:Uncharacterized protein n=1 Tax=Rhizophagus irregularis TaxID=588596 RepID=A0A2N1MEJ2_9GLOM|nr:hypothetical protein RhiirC2_266567 [Rhizophagus irregularis]
MARPHPPGKDLGRPPGMPQGPQIYPLTSPTRGIMHWSAECYHNLYIITRLESTAMCSQLRQIGGPPYGGW